MAYKVYSAGGLFTQHELATNVYLKEAVWRLSNQRFDLVLPQSKEARDFNRPNVAAFIRNTDLKQVFECDAMLVRFDGLELDAGTVVEYMVAKFLGKPSLILRCDFRGISSDSFDDPYNLMVKNWPRTAVVHVESLIEYTAAMQFNRDEELDFDALLQKEKETIQKGLDELAGKVVEGLAEAIRMPNPYPASEQEKIYHLCRLAPGSGFAEVLPEAELAQIIEALRKNKTL